MGLFMMRTSDGLVIASAGVILYWFSYFKDENERNTIYNSVLNVGWESGWQKMITNGRVKELLIFSFQNVNGIIRMNGSREYINLLNNK
jgi:hypothetical protein